MANLGNFNANDHEPLNDFEPIPAGKYPVTIIASEFKPTKSGNGSYLEIKYQILDGPHKNRLLWDRLNLDNPTPATVEIAEKRLGEICRAVGVLEPKDSVELHNLPLVVKATCKKREDNGEFGNEINGYESTAAEQRESQQSKSEVAPWKRQRQ